MEAVGLGSTGPVPDSGAGLAPLLHVLGRRSDECVRVGCVDFVRGFTDHVAVEVAHGTAEGDGADDEGDEEERVDGGHDEEAQVGERPVVADTDYDVKGCNAALDISVGAQRKMGQNTYSGESTDEFLGRLGASDNDHLHKVAADTDHDDHAESLQNADQEEHLAQRQGTVGWDRHVGGRGLVEEVLES